MDDDRSPLKTLPQDMIPKDGSKSPLCHYGISFTDHYVLKYAKRHHLTMKVQPDTRHFFGGKSEFNFWDISPEDDSRMRGS